MRHGSLRAKVATAIVCALALLSGCATSQRDERSALIQLTRDAAAAYERGDLDTAKNKYQQVLERNPQHATAHVRLGAIAYKKNDTHEARQQFEFALRVDPNQQQARYNLAMVNLSETQALLSEYSRAAQVPNRDRVLALLARLKEFEQ
jgi:superkiller protein 3